jgi:hypothetical protein
MPAELAIDVAALALYDVIIMAGMPFDKLLLRAHSPNCSINDAMNLRSLHWPLR